MNSQHITGYIPKLFKLGIIAACLFMTISLIRNINKALVVKKELEAEKEKLVQLEQKNEELRTKLNQMQTQEFLEAQIRNKFGYVKEGESVIVLPDDDVLRSLAPKVEIEESDLPDPNWKRWLKLFM